MRCLNCKKENSNHAQYCRHCGAELYAEPEPSKLWGGKKKYRIISAVVIVLVAAITAGAIYMTNHKDVSAMNLSDDVASVELKDSYDLEDDMLTLKSPAVTYSNGETENLKNYTAYVNNEKCKVKNGRIRMPKNLTGDSCQLRIEWEKDGAQQFCEKTVAVVSQVETTEAETETAAEPSQEEPSESGGADEAYKSFFEEKLRQTESYEGNVYRAIVKDLNGDGVKECFIQWDMNVYDSALYAYNAEENRIDALPEDGFELKAIGLYRVSGTDEYNLTESGDTTGTENTINAIRFRITSAGFELLMKMNGLLLEQEDSHFIDGEPVDFETFMETYDEYFNLDYVQTESNLWEEMEQFETLEALAEYLSQELEIEISI